MLHWTKTRRPDGQGSGQRPVSSPSRRMHGSIGGAPRAPTCREVKSQRVELVAARAVRWTRHPVTRRLSRAGFTPLTAQVINRIAQRPEVSFVTSRTYKSPKTAGSSAMRWMGRQMAQLGPSEPPPSLPELAVSSDKHIHAPLPGLRRTCPLSMTCTPPEFTQPHAQVYKAGGKATHPLTSYVTHRRVSSWVGDAHNPLAAPRPTLRDIHKRWCLTTAD